MKTHLFSYRTKKIAVVLFVSLFALWNTHLNAQETVHYPDERYHWNCIFDSARFYYINFTWWGSTDGYDLVGPEWQFTLTDKEL